MKNHFKSILGVLGAGLLALALGACNDSKSAATGPAAAGSFAGTTITINPTVNFLAGNALTYLNTDTGSPFPAAATATNGTYSYVPNANLTAGTLTLTVDGIAETIVLEISNFRRNGDNVTGFTARFSGSNFPVTVTGELPAGRNTNNTGGGNTSGEARADDIPASMRGTYELTFYQSDLAPINGVPADGTETTFVIGTRTLAFNGRTLTDPIFFNGNEFEWIFKDGNIWWAVSQAVNGGLNEINVQGPYTAAAVAFYGQYNDRPAPGSDIQVDSDGKFVPETSFSAALVSSDSTSSGLVYNNTPALTDPTFFNINSEGALRVSYGSGGASSLVVLPFASATGTEVEYRLQEAGTPAKDYTVTITKDADNQPTTISASFTLSNGSRVTTNTSTLTVQ